MIVLDASAALELVLGTEKGAAVSAYAMSSDQRLHAPQLIDVEVLQTLRRLALAKAVTIRRAEEALGDFCALSMERHNHETLVSRIWALRENLSAYDAVYVALAEALDAPLLTCDARLARAHGHRANITLV